MTTDPIDPTLAPVHAEMICVAVAVPDAEPTDGADDASLPLAVLDFDHYPVATAPFSTFLDIPPEDRCFAMVEPWIPLAREELDAYDALHPGHAMIRFLIARERYRVEPISALSFRVCVQQKAGFMQQVTRSDEMGVMGAGPEGVDADDDELLPPVLPVQSQGSGRGHARSESGGREAIVRAGHRRARLSGPLGQREGLPRCRYGEFSVLVWDPAGLERPRGQPD